MSSARVLVVDDHAIIRRAVCELLSRDPDLDVICETASGEEAVRKAKELQPDLILLDISLPGISGFEAARQIKKVSPTDYFSQPAQLGANRERGVANRRTWIRHKVRCGGGTITSDSHSARRRSLRESKNT
jgi:CheY-like chemotaxis protein